MDTEKYDENGIEYVQIEAAKLVLFTDEQATQQADRPEQEISWDDNGGEPDGDMYLLPLSDVTPFDGMEVVDGFIVHGYTESSNYVYWCGFSSRDVAYTTSRETAETIASDEYGIRCTQ